MTNAKRWLAVWAVTVLVGSPSLALAQAPAGHEHHGAGMNMPMAGSEALTRGEIRKWDAAQNKVTLRHEEIKNLMMAPMTMVFRVQNPAQMKDLQVGDKVVFEAVEQNGRLMVKSIRKP